FRAIAVEELGWNHVAGAEHAFHRLAPARMRNFGVNICPEAVFRWLYRFPQANRPLFHEGNSADRLDRLETVFPRQMQAERRAVLLGDRLVVGACDDEGEVVRRL